MFRIKVCGITTPEDAVAVASAGADAIGLNFYPESRRHIAPDDARTIVGALPSGIIKVGLFVNAPIEEVRRTFDSLGLDLIQLHGDEPPQYLAALGERPVMRAFRLGPEGLRAVDEYLAACQSRKCRPRLVLLDAHQPGAFGGTGQVADWPMAAKYARIAANPPLVLAGGLTPKNVGEAIRQVGPAAVDTASGVESSPPRKDRLLVQAFVRAASKAFENV